jgi:beta-xylosidase
MKRLGVTYLRTGLSWADSFRPNALDWFDRQMEVSGYHHNVRGGFMMLRPGIYAAGSGTARFRNVRYQAL